MASEDGMTYYKSLLALLLIIGLIGCATTKGDWKKAQELDTVSSYQEFLSKHQNSEYNVQGKARIEELDWEKAQQVDIINAYQGYLRKYPHGRFGQDAKSRIEELEWRSTESTNTAGYYQAFITKYPKSELAYEAKDRIEQIDWNQSQNLNTLAGYRSFLMDHPEGKFANEARNKIADIERQVDDSIKQVQIVINSDPQPFLGEIQFKVDPWKHGFSNAPMEMELEKATPNIKRPPTGHYYVLAGVSIVALVDIAADINLTNAKGEQGKMYEYMVDPFSGKMIWMETSRKLISAKQGTEGKVKLLWIVDKNDIAVGRVHINKKEYPLEKYKP